MEEFLHLRIPLAIERSGSKRMNAYTQMMNEQAAVLLVRKQVQAGDVLTLDFAFPGVSLTIDSVIRWTQPRIGGQCAHVTYLDMDADTEQRLSNELNKLRNAVSEIG